MLGTRALWYSVTAEATGVYQATVDPYDDFIVLSLFAEDCGSLVCVKYETAGIVFLDEKQEDFAFLPIELDWSATAGSTYYLVVHGQAGFSTDFGFQMVVTVRASHLFCRLFFY